MGELDRALDKLRKTYGKHTVQVGGKMEPVERIPTGIFSFDLATGGGFPVGRISILYGAESSGKTTVSLKLIAHTQKQGRRAVFFDLENSLDFTWAGYCGVDVDDLVVLRPDSAETTVDQIIEVLKADDVGIVVLDSIAAMTTTNEIQSGAEKVIVGGSALLVNKLVRKAVQAIAVEKQRGHDVTLILINQIRYKIGVMFGDPETLPGGKAQDFAASLKIRLYGKQVVDKGIHPSLPAFVEVSAIIKKFKIPVLAKSFVYQLALIPHDNIEMLESPSWKLVSNFLKKHGVIALKGDRWFCMGKPFKNQKEIQMAYESSHELRYALQSEVIRLESQSVLPEITDASISENGGNPKETIDTETGEIIVEDDQEETKEDYDEEETDEKIDEEDNE